MNSVPRCLQDMLLLSLHIFSTQHSLKETLLTASYRISKLGSERLINLFKIPLWANGQNENWTAIFGLQAQCSSHDITTSILEKQSSTFPSHLHPNKVKILSPHTARWSGPNYSQKQHFCLTTQHSALKQPTHSIALNWKTLQIFSNYFLCKVSKLQANLPRFIVRHCVCARMWVSVCSGCS